ncbi:hypothetical protein BU16DRAFT_523282 [Lophium mytilinum]|uniref:F-box domain-containing protein n=1 Tax=Lophium mytilinum TaxID=390894 RepID=A0A6A6R9V5_9PEZI|nr:hypothetical protein BU16DRAFT_523282 [Lophium mytilinum]
MPSSLPLDTPMAATTTLVDLLSNTLVLRQTAPYLPASGLLALAATSKAFRSLVQQSPDVFRYLELSDVKSTWPNYVPLDSGGITWRNQRMDESLTEDEFYSGPIRGVFAHLQRANFLKNVHTLVLDGLSVPADLVQEIIAEDRFNVRILSIREVVNLNERKLMDVLKYAVRPTRPEGTPKLKGLYVFGTRKLDYDLVDHSPKKKKPPPGAEWNHRSADALNASLARTKDQWYQSHGNMIHRRVPHEWGPTLQACEGIIFFDAVLCRGPRHDASKAYIQEGQSSGEPHPFGYLPPAIATVALGPSGCASCHSTPEGPAIFGQSPASHLPLLSPPPRQSATIRAAQEPITTDGSGPPPLIVRCVDCLKGRWCERCHKWWDENCYAGSSVTGRTELQQTEYFEEKIDIDIAVEQEIKVLANLCFPHCFASVIVPKCKALAARITATLAHERGETAEASSSSAS